MADLDPFISTTDLEALLGDPLPDPTALIVKIALDAACHRVRTYLGQDVNLVIGDVEVHSGSGRRKLRLRQRPVRSVTSVVIDDVVQDAALYSVRGAVISFRDADVWWYGNDNIEVTYSHGWDIDETPDAPFATVERVPADIRLVTLLMARRVYENVGTDVNAGAVIRETIGDYSYELSDSATTAVTSAVELLEAEMYVLDRYRIDLVGDTPTF